MQMQAMYQTKHTVNAVHSARSKYLQIPSHSHSITQNRHQPWVENNRLWQNSRSYHTPARCMAAALQVPVEASCSDACSKGQAGSQEPWAKRIVLYRTQKRCGHRVA